MDGTTFDHWTKALAEGTSSRRGVLRLILGGGVAATVLGGAADRALACRRNGEPCTTRKRSTGGCCSGTCRRGKCRPTAGAAGCTVRQDLCKSQLAACPRRPDGACIVLDNGKPFCFVGSLCVACASNADCTAPSGGIPGKCITNCPRGCAETDHHVCVYSQVVSPE